MWQACELSHGIHKCNQQNRQKRLLLGNDGTERKVVFNLLNKCVSKTKMIDWHFWNFENSIYGSNSIKNWKQILIEWTDAYFLLFNNNNGLSL